MTDPEIIQLAEDLTSPGWFDDQRGQIEYTIRRVIAEERSRCIRIVEEYEGLLVGGPSALVSKIRSGE